MDQKKAGSLSPPFLLSGEFTLHFCFLIKRW